MTPEMREAAGKAAFETWLPEDDPFKWENLPDVSLEDETTVDSMEPLGGEMSEEARSFYAVLAGYAEAG